MYSNIWKVTGFPFLPYFEMCLLRDQLKGQETEGKTRIMDFKVLHDYFLQIAVAMYPPDVLDFNSQYPWLIGTIAMLEFLVPPQNGKPLDNFGPIILSAN